MEGEIIINSTRDQIKEFKESILWTDIKRELLLWKSRSNSEFTYIVPDAIKANQSTASVLMNMGNIHGRGESIDYILGILDQFLLTLEDRKDDTAGIRTNRSKVS